MRFVRKSLSTSLVFLITRNGDSCRLRRPLISWRRLTRWQRVRMIHSREMSYRVTSWPLGSRSRVWLFVLILAAATVFAYRPAWHGGFLWDDDAYVTNNELLTARDGLRRIWFSFDSPSQYFPLVYTTFRIEHALWGLNPLGYHWVNILLHVANALLVWRLLVRLKIPGGWLAAAVFALHPVQVESVAW